MKKSSLAEDQQRMQLFQKQLKEMNEDYEYSKRSRDEAKKQLDARFNDLERKIQGSRDYISSQSKRITDILSAFQHKFEHQLKETKEQFDQKLNNYKTETNTTLTSHADTMNKLQSDLNQEKVQRTNQFQSNSKDINDKLQKLTLLLQEEKSSRIQKEQVLQNKINEQVFKLSQSMKNQRDERNAKVKEVRQYTVYQIESQTKYNQDMHKKNFQEFTTALSTLESEMNTRFSNKDEIINSLSKVVKTLQESFRYPN